MNSYIRIDATLFLMDMVCLRNISIDTLHKGNTDNTIIIIIINFYVGYLQLYI
jgi:hypothetical protein